MKKFTMQEKRYAKAMAESFAKFVDCYGTKTVQAFIDSRGIGRTKFVNLMRSYEKENPNFNYDDLKNKLKSKRKTA